MTITATVQAGKIILPPNVDWPSGTVVRIEALDAAETQQPTLLDTLKDFDGMATDMPFDLAARFNH